MAKKSNRISCHGLVYSKSVFFFLLKFCCCCCETGKFFSRCNENSWAIFIFQPVVLAKWHLIYISSLTDNWVIYPFKWKGRCQARHENIAWQLLAWRLCMDMRVYQSNIKTWICCIPKTNAVDKGISSSTQIKWSSRCCHLALYADLLALNVILRWCTIGGGEVHKTFKFLKKLQTFIACRVHGRKAQSEQYFFMKSKFKVNQTFPASGTSKT